MGIAEIAARLGVSKNWAREITSQKGFPDGTRLLMGWIWSSEDVEAYIARRWPDKARTEG